MVQNGKYSNWTVRRQNSNNLLCVLPARVNI